MKLPTAALATAAFAITGCVAVPAAGTMCAAPAVPQGVYLGPATVDKFAGRYRSGSASLHVTRDAANRFLVYRAGIERQLSTNSTESWHFFDGCGAHYDFMLPPDGPGGMLTITEPDGGKTRWTRE